MLRPYCERIKLEPHESIITHQTCRSAARMYDRLSPYS